MVQVGFSEGFRQKGFKIIAGYDHWKPAVDSFNHNFGTSSIETNILDFKNSITKIQELPNTDIIIGSPPCVSFSSSNKSGKADKTLGLDLTKSFLRVVAIKKHKKNSILKGWFMENVVNSKKYISNIYSFVDLDLEKWAKENGFNPESEALNLKDNSIIINSADYGSYQARKRVISGEIISVNKIVAPQPTNSNIPSIDLPRWNTLSDLLNVFPSPLSKESDSMISDPIYNSIKVKQSELTDHYYDSGLYKSEWKQSKELKTNHYCMGKMSFPENYDKPSRTITATKSGTSRESLIYKSEYNRKGNGEYRTPTIREVSSIMGFPFTYQFLGTINSKWRLVGNAVCPTVSRAFAGQILLDLNIQSSRNLILIKKPNLQKVTNLNDFKEKLFNKQPKRTKNSRFRRHPIKEGNITVTLSNYDIENNTKTLDKWFTSVQYGTGVNFKNQKIEDGFYKNIEPLIIKEKEGERFINIINNGFTDKIGSAKDLQKMYEEQTGYNNLLEPTELVEKVNKIINKIEFDNSNHKQKNKNIFTKKNIIPMSQVFALYAINKISSIANNK